MLCQMRIFWPCVQVGVCRHEDHQSCNCADVLNDFSDEMALLHKNIDHVFELTEDTPVPLGLRRSTSRYTEMKKFATFLP